MHIRSLIKKSQVTCFVFGKESRESFKPPGVDGAEKKRTGMAFQQQDIYLGTALSQTQISNLAICFHYIPVYNQFKPLSWRKALKVAKHFEFIISKNSIGRRPPRIGFSKSSFSTSRSILSPSPQSRFLPRKSSHFFY